MLLFIMDVFISILIYYFNYLFHISILISSLIFNIVATDTVGDVFTR